MAYDPTDWDTADDTAKTTAQHFFTDADGAHVTENASDPTTGNNVLIDSSGMFVRDGTTNVAQFKNPTIIGKTGAGEPNFKIGSVSPYGDGIFVCNGGTVKLMLWEEAGTNGGYIQSGDGGYLGIYDGNLYFTPFGQSRFTILDTSNQSGFCIGGLHIYGGSLTKSVNGTNAQIWTVADFKSTFHTSNPQLCGVCITNGDAGVLNNGAVSAEYWPGGSNPGWFAKWGSSASGTKRFNYIVTVPASISTI